MRRLLSGERGPLFAGTLLAAVSWICVPALADGQAATDYSLFDPVPDQDMRPFCTDRPTKGNNPCTVDAGHFQIESDLLNVTFADSGGIRTDTYVYTSPNFKVGLTDTVDAEVNISPDIEVVMHDHGKRSDISGFGDTIVHVKANLIGNAGGEFGAAFDPWLKIPTAANGIGNGAVEAGGIVPMQLTLSDTWSLASNPELDVLKNALDSGYHTAGIMELALTRNVSPNFTASVELWGEANADPSGTSDQYSFDLAATWSPPGTTDLQFDAGANFGLNSATPGQQYYVGISHRF